MAALSCAARALLAALLALPLCGFAAAAQGQGVGEYGLKAVFLYNFTQFVEWPAQAFASADAPLCIGVLGDDPFGATLDDAVRGEKVQGHPLRVRRARQAEALSNCHLVFVARSEEPRLREILGRLQDGWALTVGEIDGFARRGGVIGFYLEGNRLRFEISPGAAQRKELKISSHLLGLGKIVEPDAREVLR